MAMIHERLLQVEHTLAIQPSAITHAVEQQMVTGVHGGRNRISPSQTNIPSQPVASFILPIICQAVAGMEAAMLITECLERHFRGVDAAITGLRASGLYEIGDQDCVVEWREGAETEVIAVFTVENTRLPLNHVMLFGVGMGWHKAGKRFKQSFLKFQVENMQCLGSLLGVLQCVLGVPHWKQPEMPALYLAGDPENFTEEQ
jgi:hypothetical protein